MHKLSTTAVAILKTVDDPPQCRGIAAGRRTRLRRSCHFCPRQTSYKITRVPVKRRVLDGADLDGLKKTQLLWDDYSDCRGCNECMPSSSRARIQPTRKRLVAHRAVQPVSQQTDFSAGDFFRALAWMAANHKRTPPRAHTPSFHPPSLLTNLERVERTQQSVGSKPDRISAVRIDGKQGHLKFLEVDLAGTVGVGHPKVLQSLHSRIEQVIQQ